MGLGLCLVGEREINSYDYFRLSLFMKTNQYMIHINICLLFKVFRSFPLVSRLPYGRRKASPVISG